MKYWFFDRSQYTAAVTVEPERITLTNGIISRVIDTKLGRTLSFKNLFTDTEFCLAPTCEGFLKLDGNGYELGGEAACFVLSGYELSNETTHEIEWTPKSYATEINPWPASGKSVIFTYKASDRLPNEIKSLSVKLRYDIFDGIPVISKKLYIESPDATVRVNRVFTDILRIKTEARELLYLEADYRKGSLSYSEEGDYLRADFDMGPDTDVTPFTPFEGMRVFELLHSYPYYEQKQLEIRAMYRIIAPWTCEAPLFLHLISDKSEEIRAAVDSVAGVGFDMIIQSFGSGIDMESRDDAYIERVRADYDYAHSKGVEIGGYTLAIIKDYSPVRGPEATNGDGEQISRCLCTRWSEGYWKRIFDFIERTGTDMIEIDGPYHFWLCDPSAQPDDIRAEHLHHGLSDCRFAQWNASTREVLREMRGHNVYVNAPDHLYLCGSNKCAIGYEEIGWSQPREEQLLLSRVYNYNGTYAVNPSMGWSFVPIDQYQGGGGAATFEPLDEHLAAYEWAIAVAFISGVQPCFRGRRLYDTERTRQTVAKWAGIYKKYRRLLNGYTIHFMPPRIDKDKPSRALCLDAILQVNPDAGEDKAFLGVFNQTERDISQTLYVPLYYSSLTELKAPPCPAPHSHPAEVYVPFFGKYPPSPPTDAPSDTPDAYPETAFTGEKVLVCPEGDISRAFEARVDGNGNAVFEVALGEMSFAWFTIRGKG